MSETTRVEAMLSGSVASCLDNTKICMRRTSSEMKTVGVRDAKKQQEVRWDLRRGKSGASGAFPCMIVMKKSPALEPRGP